MDVELSYLARRAAEEKRAASVAGDPRVRRVHDVMASRYDALVMFLRLCTARSDACFAGTA